MAQMKYEDFVKFNEKQSNQKSEGSNRGNYVGYFALKDDNESAVVRFNISSLDDINIVSKHTVENKDGKRRIISCLRSSPTDPLSVCPLCEASKPVAFRAYIPLIYFEQNENNEVVPVAALWEQSPKIRDTLQAFIDNYGDLRDYLFKIVRQGKRGDTNTTYTILPANNKIYKDEVFPKDFSAFDNLDFERFVAVKTAEEMHQFLEEGDFPFRPTTKQKLAEQEKAATESEKPAGVSNTYNVGKEEPAVEPEPEQVANTANTTTTEEPNKQRPRRTYIY